MSELSQGVCQAFANEYRDRAAELHKWADPLSDEQFWRNPFGYGNSASAIWCCISPEISATTSARSIADTGLRPQPRFRIHGLPQPSKNEVLQKFDDTIAMVIATIENQSEADWTAPYTAEREPDAKNRFTSILRCATHLYHHVGQINLFEQGTPRILKSQVSSLNRVDASR